MVKYNLGKDNKIRGDMQRIRITQGCINQCKNCYEPKKVELYLKVLTEIKRNKVVILNMNLLDPRKPAAFILDDLTNKRINNKFLQYEVQCGFDYRYITPKIAELIYRGRFGHFRRSGVWRRNIKIAWDGSLDMQYKFRKALEYLFEAGFKINQISVFMLVNKDIPLYECDLKLDFLKVWNLKVNDCCFDGGYKVAIPKSWTHEELKYFRHKSAIHNQLINYRSYPDLKRAKNIGKKLLALIKTKTHHTKEGQHTLEGYEARQ